MPGPVVASGDRVVLRTVERDDAAFLQTAATDPRVRFSLGMDAHRTEAETRERIEEDTESDGALGFVVCLDEDGAPAGRPDEGETTPVGAVHARNLDGVRAWLGYWLAPAYHSEGYGTEAVELVVDELFRSHPVHVVSAGAFGHNEASQALLESLGFTREGRLRDAWYVDGAYRDGVQYGVLRREWEA